MQPQAREKGEKEGFEVSIAKTSFKANTKALAENEGEGLAKVIYLYLSFLVLFLCKSLLSVHLGWILKEMELLLKYNYMDIFEKLLVLLVKIVFVVFIVESIQWRSKKAILLLISCNQLYNLVSM